MNIAEKLEGIMLAITLAEAGKPEWAQKILSELDEKSRFKEKATLGDKLSVIEFYLESLCERGVKIETTKFFRSKHYLILVKNLTGLVRHHVIFACQFLTENTAAQVIEKLMSWHLRDVLRKAGKNVVLVGEEGLYVPSLGRPSP